MRDQTISRLHPTVKAAAWVSLFTDVSSDMIIPLLPLFLKSVLMSGMTFIGVIEGAAETTASFLKLFSGYISDRLHRRKALVLVGYTLSSITRPLMAATQASWHVLSLRIADRVGKGIRTSPRDALIADCTPPETRGFAFGYQRGMDNAGAIIGPLIGAGLLWMCRRSFALGDATSFRLVFALAALPGLLAPFIIVRFIRDSPPAVIEPRPNKQKSNDGVVRGRPLGSVFWTYIVAVLLFTLGNSSDAFLILRANQAGLPDWQIPLLWSAFNAVKSLSSMPGGRLSDRVGRKPMILTGWLIYSASYLLFGIAGTAWKMCAILLFYGLYYGCAEGTERALVSDLVVPEMRGTAFGIFHGAIGIAALPASILFGAVWQWTGYPLPAFFMGAGLSALAAAVLVLVPCK